MLAHKEAMRLEGIKEAESEAMLLAIQDMESEKQWNKRYTAWGWRKIHEIFGWAARCERKKLSYDMILEEFGAKLVSKFKLQN